MKIIIPTYRRVDRQFTLRCIPKEWRRSTVLVCDDEDAPKLEKHDVNIKVVPPKIKTIAQKRAWIIRKWAGHKILMLDDDLRFCRRDYSKPKTFLRQATAEDVSWALNKVAAKLAKFAHVGIAPRQGNNNLEAMQRRRIAKSHGAKNVMAKHIRWEPNSRMIYALGYDTDVVLEYCRLGRIEHREDMDYTLQLMRHGFENRVLAEVCVDQTYAGPGGARLERTMETSNADAEKLARLHPGYVKVVEKEYKQSIPRKEVICYWKKAIKEAKS